MQEHSHFIIGLNDRLYGIRQDWIEEIFLLPELTPVSTNTYDIVGVVDLRGEILPVIDLRLSLGYQATSYKLTDKIIVLRCSQLKIGIISNEIYEERKISLEQITTKYLDDQSLPRTEQGELIAGIVPTAGNILILNHPEIWFNIQQILLTLTASEISGFNDCPNANLEEKVVFRQRADRLKLSIQNQELKDLKPVVVFALGNYFWSINLELVREFVDIRNVIPIPCCPTHIIGNINLRGEILTLVDLRTALNLPSIGIPDDSKAIVVEVEDIVVGIIVEQVCDAMFLLNPQKITATTAMPLIRDKYLQGASPYGEK